jgi:transcription elongation factor GreA
LHSRYEKSKIIMIEYITQECHDKLMAELHELLHEERPRIAEAISEARDKGDLSENFEYHAAKREQSKLEGRIDRLKVKLSNTRIIERSRLSDESVQLFCTVELTDLTHNRSMTYSIVNPTEADFSSGKISIKTPIAQGLLKKKVGDIAEIKVPAGTLKLRVDKISIL